MFKEVFFSYMHKGMGSKTTSTDEMLETENNRMVDDLAAKVSRLKGVRRHKPPKKIVIHLWSHSSAFLTVIRDKIGSALFNHASLYNNVKKTSWFPLGV